MSILYVVATPIGNLEDITLRAINVLKEVTLIAAEDTRKTRILLNAYQINTPMTSYYEHNKLTKLNHILKELSHGDVALVSEAGLPGISDPGYELIKGAIGQGTKVVPIPGVSAITTALVVSGLPTDRFLFVGYLPSRANARRKSLKEIAAEKSTLIFYEAPHRLLKTLSDILDTLGERRIAACRELTKIHEEIFRGTVSEALTHFVNPRGEFTLIVEGVVDKIESEPGADIESRVEQLRGSGIKAKEAIAVLSSETGLSRKELYRIWLRQK
jgi:16S rRNA (cytidine1402-2'-O)-methyltransferase